MMNNTHDYLYHDLLKRSISAFHAVLKGSEPDVERCDAPMMDRYVIVLQGETMSLRGWVEGHPRLGTSLIQTSLLIHISKDRKWARTLSRWYRLGEPERLGTSQLSLGIDLPSFCVPIGLDGISIPLHLARRVMELQPTRLTGMAAERGFNDVSKTLSDIANRWPPQT
ncbi:DUF6634 family protein [Donghicola mangrovi]|uniref:Uncharacterized protein n=1 Tax=Donghicola mangrovi TaxID=2729614 RepID=A0A850Q974_9RHOB|nr:DUF6634 family protein [Donghicola mangrovi]NVO23320.1 hypothetical protein [Donghicola mangrovi]